MNVGDILNYAYTGGVQTVSLPPGTYRLEVWGAEGGDAYNNANYKGGKGGYSVGEITLTSRTTMNIYVGGKGKSSTAQGIQSGGYNGGGAGSYTYGGSGGGGTDIRRNGTSLSDRIIVAGGGGGAAYYSTGYVGGAGGGTSGVDGSYYTGTAAKGGTQSAGGAGSTYSVAGNAGSLGQGGAAANASNSYSRSGGGGGGYYGGGGGGYYNNSSRYYYGIACGGGGSGYIGSLSNASTLSGTSTITEPSGSTATGHTGDGYARITVLDLSVGAPENIQQAEEDCTTVTLEWEAGAKAVGCRIYRDGAYIGSTTGTSYTDTGLLPDSEYTYTLISYDGNGSVSEGADFVASTKFAYYVAGPRFTDGSFTVNPVNINGQTILRLWVEDVIIILEETYRYAGEYIAGEA